MCHCFSSASCKVPRPSTSSSNLTFEVGIWIFLHTLRAAEICTFIPMKMQAKVSNKLKSDNCTCLLCTDQGQGLLPVVIPQHPGQGSYQMPGGTQAQIPQGDYAPCCWVISMWMSCWTAGDPLELCKGPFSSISPFPTAFIASSRE